MPSNIVMLLMLLLGAVFFAGCSSSAPRFGSHEKKTQDSAPPKHEPRFSSQEAVEEKKEDDKKVETKEVERITSGQRDFKQEKNSAIKPLDQSKMMKEISKYMGVPYLHGGCSSDGMDCSGYTMTVYKNSVGITLPRSSAEQSKLGTPVEFEKLKFGDLVFFNTTGETVSHVGIYLGDDLFAHASVSLGVTISSLQSAYFAKRYECARRVID
ncbi:MAG TPA: NlpC/P60 family protein [Bacteroidota bacterium]|nr:NlpC/P60 family protein [Bacteroidota bacterium]